MKVSLVILDAVITVIHEDDATDEQILNSLKRKLECVNIPICFKVLTRSEADMKDCVL